MDNQEEFASRNEKKDENFAMMDLKTGLKWIFFLFCIVTTFQLILTVILTGLIGIPLGQTIYCRTCLIELMVISLASTLPTLILVQGKIFAWIPMTLRRAIHFLLTFSAVCGLLIYFNWYDVSLWLLLPFSIAAIIYVFATFFLEKFILAKRSAQQNAEEQKRLQHYTEELERHQLDVQKFKHDYQNILLSLDAYIEDGDLAGLRQYYRTSIQPTSTMMAKSNFSLNGLDKIKIQAIKSFLAAKLMLAQRTDAEIHLTFEANEHIDHIPLDSVVLVRILGILLDNAIEELTELDRGELFVSCLKWDAGTTFIVQNTCQPNLPSLQQLWQTGFSTKDKSRKRGFGLPNLSELIDAHPNITLSTKILENSFRQELLIQNTEGYSA